VGALRGGARGFRGARRRAGEIGGHEEIVLLFEHDVYDQLQLIQILDRFPGRDLGGRGWAWPSPTSTWANSGRNGCAPSFREAYVGSHQEREEPVFLGDTVFVSYPENVSTAEVPLVVFEDCETIRVPHAQEGGGGVWDRRAMLTEKGQEVLRGDDDRVGLNGIDRWLGGTHLSGEDTWRWDGSEQALKRPSPPSGL
jgi:hypothetical protein